MATKLKKLHLTSVDLVRAGANQEADICLHKSADEDDQEANLFKRFLSWLKNESSVDNPVEKAEESVEKDYVTFDQVNDNRESQDKLWRYTDALHSSFRSIQEDHELSMSAKEEMMKTSLGQFTAAMEELVGQLCRNSVSNPGEPVVAKVAPEYDEIEEM